MKVTFIEHVPFEGPGSMADWFESKGFELAHCKLFEGDRLPLPEESDWLVVMGGPMGIADEADYSWLKEEKACIRSFIEAGKIVLGICLGAQLIADVLGADVTPGEHKEIGWHPLFAQEGLEETCLKEVLPEVFPAFHWHGDTFAIPAGAQHILASRACAHQGFVYEDRVFAFQFHLETTPQSASLLVQNAGEDLLDEGRFIQSEKLILSEENPFSEINRLMGALLDKIYEQ
ncbi:MAG: type 1 glutamine amidotransferase [Spirochaetales bacterium]|nr:type 1 glutamine amidotransferase [Spirochaetales bacterium]